MVYSNYFENQTPTSIADDVALNITNSIQQYSLPTESLDFISANRSADLVNQVMFPLIGNIETNETTIPSEKLTAQFSCKHVNCNKTYASVSGLNNHMKK